MCSFDTAIPVHIHSRFPLIFPIPTQPKTYKPPLSLSQEAHARVHRVKDMNSHLRTMDYGKKVRTADPILGYNANQSMLLPTQYIYAMPGVYCS